MSEINFDPALLDESLTPLERGMLLPTNISHPDMPVSHGRDVSITDRLVSLCGEPWVPVTDIGGEPAFCITCMEIAQERGL